MAKSFVTVEEIETIVQNRDEVRFVDCRYSLDDPDYGIKLYNKAHIPGANFAHLDKDLSGDISSDTGRHPLPSVTNFHQWVKSQGLSPDQTIIAYDDIGGGIAARLWWMLRQFEFTDIYILVGGIQAYSSRYKLSDEKVEPVETNFQLPINDWSEGPLPMALIQEVENLIGKQDLLIDSRSPERYRGDEEPIDTIPGRIPGSTNYYWKSNIIEETNTLKERSVILNQLTRIIDTENLKNSIIYCGSGVTACLNIAVMDELNLDLPHLFPGSYSEWIRNKPNKITTNHPKP